MSTTDPAGDGGGGGTSTTNVDSNVTPITPSTGIAVPPGSHHQQHPPPSPLSGCYLLVVLPEPHTAQHRDLILNRLAKGFLSWDKDSCHVDLEKELQALVAQAPEGEEARNGERLIQYATENLVTEVLIHPQTNTLLQCIRNLLASFTKHRHIIHAGYTFGGNGSWILQDGTFSLADFLDAFSEHEVQRVLRAYENSVTVDINCAGVGEWSTSRLSKETCTRSCRVRLNPDDVLTAGVPAITSFTNYVGQYLIPQTLDQLMEPSDVVGNIRFSHPTLYVFPGGQGDAALFGINGFNMLVDGGFARKACFWDFARHLDRLDAVLVTRINNSNVGGMSSVLRKKKEMHVYPQIGHFFCNLVERRHSNSPDGDKDLDPLILNLTDIGQEMMVNLRQINLRAHPCYRDPNPINLYHKVGHGTLDMYVLSPNKDSREVKEFLAKWHASDSKLFAGSHRKDPNILTFPIQNLASICALLVWQPANPEDTITRILFPGSTPQHKIFEGFERLKHLDFLKHPICTAKSLSPSTSLLALKDRPIKPKLGLIEKEPKKAFDIKKEKRDLQESKLSKAAEEISKPQATPIIPISKPQPAKVDVKSKKVVENKKIEIESKESKRIEKDLKEMKKDVKKDISKMDKESEIRKIEGMRIKTDSEKLALIKESKAKPEPKKKEAREPKPAKLTKTETGVKLASKMPDKKPKPLADRKESAKASPPTPKKTMNGSATKVELAKTAPKPISKPTSKQPLSTMPAKSAKDANNRKVLEQKNIEIASAAGGAATSPAAAKLIAKPKGPERKPISRRAKPVSPSKARVPGSPAKSTRSTPTTSVKSDKDGVIRKVKGDRGTTDSSTVSTPSGIEIDSMMKLADKSLAEKSEDMSLDSIESKVLADLKEEREVVEEIEAVLQKAERIEEARKDDHLEGDDDITAEATDKKEDDLTEEDVTADMEEAPKKATSRKPSQELTEEDEYLIIEKEEIYIEDSAQSGEGEQKHILDAVESEKVKTSIDIDTAKEDEETEVSEEKEKSDIPEKKLILEEKDKEKETDEMSPGHKEQLQEEMKDIIASATEIVQKTEDKDDSGKKDSEDITKEPSSLSPDKFDSSEKKTTDTDMKPEVDQKEPIPEKLEESQERISTLESGATTTAPTLPEDERIPLDEIKEVVDEKYIVEEVKEKDTVEEVKESFVAPIPTEPKPETKPFEVRPPLSGVQRDIVKTPDEVADLPVHEEVDPKLYRMEDFEKAKDEKQAPPETKEPPTPPVKEQKGVFSFFGKVADKFEKGIDKLTGKSRRDSEKDIDEKSSSKSSSPKEARPQELAFLREAQVNELSAKVDKIPEVADTFEKGEPEASKVKLAAIKDTAAFLHGEIEDAKKTVVSGQEPEECKDFEQDKISSDKPEIKTLSETKAAELTEPVFETCVLKGEKDKLTSSIAGKRVEDIVEDDVEEVEALLEEASKKFKTVKDSLRDSLESLEDKIVEEAMVRDELAAASKDVVKDTLSEVVGKLEEITPYTEVVSPDTKEPEKVKFDIPKSEDFEDEDEDDFTGPTKDFKEAVRDVGEVLAGSAGIVIEEKPKDVIEIVKKVAEVLKKDDFLSHDVLFEKSVKAEEKISDEITEALKSVSDSLLHAEEKAAKPIIEGVIIPKKVGITEELPPQEEIEEMLESGIVKPLLTYKQPDGLEVQEEPCTKTLTDKGSEVTSPIRDPELEKADAKKICADLMKDEPIQSRPKRSLVQEESAKTDVMDAGIEDVCVKEEVKHQTSREDEQDQDIEVPVIAFDRRVSPTKAELVMVTPDSAPTSPKFPIEKMQAKEAEATLQVVDGTFELPAEIKEALEKEGSLENLIEDLVFSKKKKITIEIVEYITVIRKIPREKVIYIIEEIIIKKRVPRDSVVADLDLLRPDTVSPDKRLEIEQYIDQEYIKKNKKITIEIVEEISVQKFVTKRIVIEIIEEIIVKKKIPRDSVLDITEKQCSQIGVHRKRSIVAEEQDETKHDETVGIDFLTAEKHSDIEKYIVDELISKGKKITAHIIDDVCVAKEIPRHVFIQIIEEIIVKRKIPRSSILDISEKDLSEIIATEKEDIMKDGTTTEAEVKDETHETKLTEVQTKPPEKLLEIENNIYDEYVAKGRRITPYIFEDLSARYQMSRHIIIEIIEDIILKHKLRRESVINISDIELVELLEVEKQEDEQEAADTTADDEKHHKFIDSEIEGVEEVTSQTQIEIEEYIVDEFLTKGRKIKPYIFEDICVQYKVPRRIVIEIIELIILKRNIPRTAILDITETELSQLLAVVEAEGDEDDEIDVTLNKQKALPTEEDKLIDGFVNIPSKDDTAQEKDVSPVLSKTIELAEPAFKESDKDVADDFEAVEQEYKIHGTPITPAKKVTSVLSTAKEDDKQSTDDIDEAAEDDMSDVIEAEEKIIVTAAKTAIDKKFDDVSESSEIVDTTEKYLIEAQEKTDPRKQELIQSLDTLVDDAKQIEPKAEEVTIATIKAKPLESVETLSSEVDKNYKIAEDFKAESISETTKVITPEILKDSEKIIQTEVKIAVDDTVSKEDKDEFKLPREKVLSPTQPTEIRKPSIAELKEEPDKIKSEQLKSKEELPTSQDKEQRKDSLIIAQGDVSASVVEKLSPKDEVESCVDVEESATVTGTVRRMVVTASSEDGGQEIEVCPTGSITFQKTGSPDDSLKSLSVKSTPEQDSLLLDKEPMHSGTTTPEKDSISGKSTPGTKTGDKITPEDSLDKSPLGTRGSQDLEDSLDKSDLIKVKDVVTPKTPTEQKEDVVPLKPDTSHEEVPVSIVSDDTMLIKSAIEKTLTEKQDGLPKTMPIDATAETEKSIHKTEPIEGLTTKPVVSGITHEMLDEEDKKFDKPRSLSVASLKDSEKESGAIDETVGSKLTSPSATDKVTSSVITDATSAISQIADTKEPQTGLEKSRTPSIIPTTEGQSEVVSASKSSSPSLHEEPIDTTGSKSPSLQVTEDIEKAVSEETRSRSSSIASEKHKDITKASIGEIISDGISDNMKPVKSPDKSVSPDLERKTTEDLKIEDKPLDKSRSARISSDKRSIAGEKISASDEEDVVDKLRSPSVAEMYDQKEFTDRSRSSSIIADKLVEKDSMESVDMPRSPSHGSEKFEDTVSIDRSKSPSTVQEKHDDLSSTKLPEKLRSPSLHDEERDEISPSGKVHDKIVVDDQDLGTAFDEKKSLDRSRSSSTASEKHVEKDSKEILDTSTLPSIVSEKVDDRLDSLKPSTVDSDLHSEKESTQVAEKESFDHTTPDSIVDDKIIEKDLSVVKSRSPSVISDKASTDGSKSPSVADGKHSEKEQDEKIELAPLKSSSIISEKLAEGNLIEAVDKSRTPSLVTETIDDKSSIDRSRSPSIAGEKLTDVDLKGSDDKSRKSTMVDEVVGDDLSIDHSRSPSIASDKQKSRTPSIRDELVDDTTTIHRSPSSSSVEKTVEKDLNETIDTSKSPILVGEKVDITQSADRSKSPSIADDKLSEKDAMESVDKSRSPSIASEKPVMTDTGDRSRSVSITDDKLSVKDVAQPIEKSRTPSIASDKLDTEPVDRSKSPSIIDDKHSVKDVSESSVKSRSPSITSEKPDDHGIVDRSKSPSIADDKWSEKDATEHIDKSKSPSITSEKPDDQELADHSKTSSIAGDKLSEKEVTEPIGKSRSSSITSERPDDKALIDRSEKHPMESIDKSRSPSIPDGKLGEKDADTRSKSPSIIDDKSDKSRSPSIVDEKLDDKESVDRSKSPIIASDKPSEKDVTESIDKPKIPTVSSEKRDDKEAIDRSKSPSIADDKYSDKDVAESIEKSRSPSVTSDKLDDQKSVDGDKIKEKDVAEPIDKYRKSSISSEKPDDKGPIDRSKSPSIVDEKLSVKDSAETVDKSRSPSIASEKPDDRGLIDSSKSPSIADDKLSEKDVGESIGKSRSPSVTSEKLDDKKSVDGDKVSEKDVAESIDKSRASSISSEKPDDKGPIDHSKSPSIIDEKLSVKDSAESVDKSRSPSITSEKSDDRGLIDLSKSPSITDDKLSEKDVGESIEKSRASSVTSEKVDGKVIVDDDKLSEKDATEPVEKSRTSSILSEKPDDKEAADRSKSPSIIDDIHSENDAAESIEKSKSPVPASEKPDDQISVVLSKSPSTADDKVSEDVEVAIEKSRSSSMTSEKHDDKGPVDINKLSEKDISEPFDKSRTPSISSEKLEDKGPMDRSISPSIADDKHSEKDAMESVDKSRSPSTASEKAGDKGRGDADKLSEKDVSEPIDKSRTSSISSVKPDDKGPGDGSKSPNGIDDKHSEKDAIESMDRSRSPSITSEKIDDRGNIDHSKSPSITDEKHEKEKADRIEKSRTPSISSEKPDDKEPLDRSKSPSIIDDKYSEKDITEFIDKSRSPSITSEKAGDRGPIDRSKSPSIADDKHSEKDLEERIEKSRSPSIISEKSNEKELTEQSKPSSISDDKVGEKDVTEPIDKSKISSVTSAKPDDLGPSDRSKSPSIADDKHSEKDVGEQIEKPRSLSSEKLDDKELTDHLKSFIISDDKLGEKDLTKPIDKSRTPSISSEKLDDTKPGDRSKSPSIIDDKHSEKDATESVDKSRSPSITSEKHDDRKTSDHSKSPSIVDDKHSDKDITEQIQKSRSPSIASEKSDNKKPIDRSKSPSIADNTEELVDKFTSLSVTGDKLDDKEFVDHLKSPTIIGDRHGEKDTATRPVEKSRSSSICSEQLDEKEHVDRSKSPSIAGDKHSERDVTELIDKSRSSSIVSDRLDTKKSPTISDDKQSETHLMESIDRSRSPSISHEKLDEYKADIHSKSPSITDDKASEKDLLESVDKLMSPTTSDKKLGDKESDDRSKSPTITEEKRSEKGVTEPVSKSISPDAISEKFDAVEQVLPSSRKSSSPSIVEDKQHSQEPIDLSKTSIVIGDQITKMDIDKSKFSSSIDQTLDHKKSAGPTDVPQTIGTVADVTEKQEFVTHLSADSEDKLQPSIIQSDKFKLPVDTKSDVDKAIDESRSASIVGSHPIEKETTKFQADSKLTEVPIRDSKLDEREAVQALQKLAETIADKSTEIKYISKSPTDGTAPHDTPRDRSRSHSLFDTGEKTPLGRSRTASLFDDKVPEGLSLLDEVKNAVQQSEYIYDEVDESKISKEGGSRKESLISDGLSKRSSVAIPEEIAGQLTEDPYTSIAEITKIEEYIVNKYIIKKEKITSQIVEDIAKLYSISNSQIMKLIEFIIVKMNVPRDSIVNYPKDDETCDSTVALIDDHVDMVDITLTKRQDIESYINDEFIAKNKKISSKMVDELAHLKSVSRYVIIAIIEEVITKKKLTRASLLEDGIFDDSKTEGVPSAATDSKRSSVASIVSHGPSGHEDRQFEEDVALPSISTDYMISPKVAESSVIHRDKESPISEQKRIEIESYVMEECVKKGTKITVLVLEQIMTKMAVSKPILLDIIENIIITRKMSRKTMVDDAIYDDIESTTGKSSPELVLTKDRIVAFSGKSTPDPKSSGYSTPETRQYDDKFSKDVYSSDYESPFHKAFVGGMTEIRTTHITTLSGKSTPDFGTRGETPESLSDSITSSSQVRIEEKLPSGKVSPLHETPDGITGTAISQTTVEQAPSISTASVTMVTTATTISSALDSASELKQSVSSFSDEAVADEPRKMVKREISESKVELAETDRVTNVISQEIDKEEKPVIVTKVIKKEVLDDDEPEVITRVIRKEVIEEDEPQYTTKVITKEIIDEGEPEMITRIIRREIIDDVEEIDDDTIHGTVTRKISQGILPEIVETITTRTTKTIVTEDGSDYETSGVHTTTTRTGVSSDAEDRYSPDKTSSESSDVTKIVQDTAAGGPISADVKRTVTTVTTVTEPDGKITTKKDVQESTDILEGEKLLEKLIDSTKTTDSTKVTDAKSIESLKTEKIITETIKTMTTTSGTSTPGIRTDFDSGKSTPDSVSRDDKSDALGKAHLEKIVADKLEHPISPIIKDLISDERSYSGKSSPDVSLPKDIQFSGSTGKSTPEIPISPYARDGATGHPHMSGRSTPDKRPDSRSSTATPEGFRSGEVIRTIITTTRTMSEDGDIVTTTKEITETTNDKGETIILAEKTDVKVEDCIPAKDMTESIYGGGIQETKGSTDFQRTAGLGSDMPSDKDIGLVSPHSDHSSIHSRAGTHAWGSSEERHTYSDDEPPGSPLSTTSQVGYSPQSTYHFGEQSFGKDSSHKSMEFSEADMSSSFYGELPDLPPRATTMKTAYLECSEASGTSETGPNEGDFTFKKFTIEKEFAGGYSEKSGSKRYVDDADLDFEKALMERKEMKRDREHSTVATSGYTNGSIASSSSSTLPDDSKDSKDDTKKDPLAGWDTPLGLPSPKPPRKFNLRTTPRTSNSADISPDSLNFDVISDWGEPLRLPSPAPIADEASNKGAPSTPKKERKQPKKVITENIKNRKRSESPSKNEKKSKDAKNKIQPVYMDLTYVPHHGNSYYTSLEFFKKIRARYYVFSGTEPSREVYDALLDAKKTWEDKDLEVTMIPTYDTDTLGYWVADNEEALAANHIDLSPSASRCTINLQDHETSCSAYRLEF